jgi:cytochrome c553
VKIIPTRYLIAITAGTLLLSSQWVAANDPQKGQQKSAVCQGCHGPDGNSLGPTFPNLASQNASYIQKQITDFQGGKRKDPTMSTMVTGLSKDDISDIAAYFSSQKLKPAAAKTQPDTDVALGKKIYKGGNTYNGVPACAGCHGPNGVGNGPGVFPRIAGQKITYLEKALNDFKSGTRSNDPKEIMRRVASKLSEKEIKAVAAYASSM